MKPLIIVTAFILTLNLAQSSFAQDNPRSDRFTAKEFSIPPTPIFDLMGVTSAQVNRTSDIKDFKVDWSFKSYKLNPNLALQSQPVWEIFYNRKDLNKYQKASVFMRKLATLDISFGTVQDENSDRRIGIAGKINLYREKDPLMAKELYVDIGEKYSMEKTELETQLQDLNLKLDTTTNVLEKPDISAQIKAAEDQLMTQNSRRMEEINSRAKIYVQENWNASGVDIAFGKVFSFITDSASSLSKLRLNRSTALGAWINASVGLGKKFLLSGLFRTSWYQEEVDFLLKDKTTLDELPQKAVADNTLFTMGVNLRYGSPAFSFFVELFYERKSLKTPMEALDKAFEVPSGNFEIVSSSTKWTIVNPNTLSVGGDWRISRNLLINYGLRGIFDKNWKFTALTPVVTISCMMR